VSRSIYLTGATGFLGGHIHRQLGEAGFDVVRIGRRDAEVNADLLRGGPSWTGKTAGALVHCAGVMRADAGSAVESASMTVHLLRDLPEDVRRVVLVSSAYVYGWAKEPVREDAPPAPEDVYGETKLAIEGLFRAHCRGAGRALVILRPCAIYGEGEPHGKAVTRFVADVRAGRPIVLRGDVSRQRDYIHVDDAARAVLASLSVNVEPGEARVYNVCTGTSWSAIELARIIARVRPELVGPLPEHAGEPLGHRFDPTRAAEELGFRAQKTLDRYLLSCLRPNDPA
jgi:nucleoside-diphosphate-sugar epimerase